MEVWEEGSGGGAEIPGSLGITKRTAKGIRERRFCVVGTVEQFPTKSQAQKSVEVRLLKPQHRNPTDHLATVTFVAICDRYLEQELPERYSTAKSYRSNIKNYLKPCWGDYLLDKIRPMAVEDWLKNLPVAPKSKAHIRGVMHLMFECATRWEIFNEKHNPIALVRSKRRQRPIVLTVEQFELSLRHCASRIARWCKSPDASVFV